MKNNKKVAAFALVLVAAFLLAGIGYAYTSTTVTDNHTVTDEYVVVKTFVGDTETYSIPSGTAADIKYDYSKIGTAVPTYGVEFNPVTADPDDDLGQSLTSIDKIVLVNQGNLSKNLTKLVVTVSGNEALTTQFATGDYKNSVLKMRLYDPSDYDPSDSTKYVEIIIGDEDKTATKIVGEFTSFGDLTTTMAEGASITLGFSFVIMGDVGNYEEPVCNHTQKLDAGAFKLAFKAVAADVA